MVDLKITLKMHEYPKEVPQEGRHEDHNPDGTLKTTLIGDTKPVMLMSLIEDAYMQHDLMSRALQKGLVRGFLS